MFGGVSVFVMVSLCLWRFLGVCDGVCVFVMCLCVCDGVCVFVTVFVCL